MLNTLSANFSFFIGTMKPFNLALVIDVICEIGSEVVGASDYFLQLT